MDWKKIINDLLQAGLTKQEIARKGAISLSLINSILSGDRGRRISWHVGNALLLLHVRVVDKTENLAVLIAKE